jgi:PRC-barrel domain
MTTREDSMPQGQLFRLEAGVRCADGDCGTLTTLVINRPADAVTHLVVEPAHREGPGRIVPFGLVDIGGAGTAQGEVRLRCTRAEFEQLDPAEATLFPGDEDYENTVGRWEPDALWPYYGPPSGMMPGTPGTPGALGAIPEPVTVDIVSDRLPGEDEVARGEHVHATDGDIGHVLGFVVETGSGRVTSILLREGHLLGRRTVLIPRSAVAEVGADGFRLSITREQVRHLPPVDAEHLPTGLQTVSASIPVQPRRAIRSSVAARRLPVTTNVPNALISRFPNRSPAASRSTPTFASNAAGSRSLGSSPSAESLIGAGSTPAMSACLAASRSIRGPPAPTSSRGAPDLGIGRTSRSSPSIW